MSRIASKAKETRRVIQQWLLQHKLQNYDPIFISDGQGWILDDYSQSIMQNLPDEFQGYLVDFVLDKLQGKTLHFIERYRFFRQSDPGPLCDNNRVVVTWWHGGASKLPQVHLDELLERVAQLAHLPITYHITSSLYTGVLVERGIQEQNIHFLPMGVDNKRFVPRKSNRVDYKNDLRIPTDKICIGYFQRDGDENPKLVKGPDVFLEVMRRMWAKQDNLFILLAGPKRGYVMRHLEEIGIPYHYAGWVPYTDMAPYYYASDLYLITSREEGGPAAVLECMATGTPLISTRVGMAVDVVKHGDNGFLTEIEDVDAITHHALQLITNPQERVRIGQGALETAPAYDWTVLAPRYAEILYSNGDK